ncbi:hypothetical protein EVAR_100760_1 [Eumeta japonica]|uniref:Uncharacterized protein n=1 Tax=Eumeta variegata TaxID=151549 RepID=A0A4C1SEC7_EUMVA|nr:hypothetical protein EVAR_100760_1 [Eumeta japonica]
MSIAEEELEIPEKSKDNELLSLERLKMMSYRKVLVQVKVFIRQKRSILKVIITQTAAMVLMVAATQAILAMRAIKPIVIRLAPQLLQLR